MDFQYFDEIRRILAIVEKEENETMEKVVELLSEAILNKHAIFTFGASHAGILSEELYYRAGGLLITNPIFGKEIMLDNTPITLTSQMERLVGYGSILACKTPFKAGDVLIAHSVSGRNPVTIELAIEAKKKGVIVIALTNLAYSQTVTSRHPSNLNLYQVCDLVIDNHGAVGDACISIQGLQQKVSPTSTVIGATILNSIIAKTTQVLIEKGLSHPPIFYSANLDGGDSLNDAIYEEYKDVIHYQYK